MPSIINPQPILKYAILIGSLSLLACQPTKPLITVAHYPSNTVPNRSVIAPSTTGVHYLDTVESNKTLNNIPLSTHQIVLGCRGFGCQIASIDSTIVFENYEDRMPVSTAQHLIRPLNRVQGIVPYVVMLPAGQHEVRLRFKAQPQSADISSMTMVYPFKGGEFYQFEVYKIRQGTPASVLKMATPDPICVSLLQQEKRLKTYCRHFNVTTGLGEFTEVLK